MHTILDGGGWDNIVRRLVQNIMLVFGNPLWLLIPLVLVLFAGILARPNWWAAAPLRRSFARVQLLRPGLISIVVWVIGATLNDSGAAIPAAGATLACPLVIAIALTTLQDERAA